MSRLANKWILITGASSGFGAAGARAFAAEGSKLLLGARRVDRLKTVAADAKKAGSPEALYHPLDVTSTKSVETFVAWAKEKTQRLDVLINNAGGAHGLDPIVTATDEDWETTFQTNVLGLLRMTRAALPLLVSNPGSCIINIGSLAAHTAYENGAAYCGAKAAELQITRSLRLEMYGTGVRVCSLDPGLSESEFSSVRFKGDEEKVKKVYEGTHPLQPEDIAETMVWVASRPAHVNIDNLIIKPTDQAAIYKLYRRK